MSIKIIKELGDNRYEVEIKPLEDEKANYIWNDFGLAHDYFYVYDDIYLRNADNSVSRVKFRERVTVPIRAFTQVMLPKLLENEYSKMEHLAERSDKHYKTREPIKYHPYSHNNYVVQYYDENKKQMMVAVLLQGEAEFNHITLKFFNEFIKDNLKYKRT